MVTLRNITKSYGSSLVLADISFSLGAGEKVALVGPNGVGKSTLLQIIAGQEEADSGTITKPPNWQCGVLSQEIDANADETINDYLGRVTGITAIESRIKELEPLAQDAQHTAELESLQEAYLHLHGYAFESRAETLLEGFGLTNTALDTPVANLSGGEKRKAALTGVLLRGVDVLLLDEPTNNLDIAALEWLEYFVRETDSACIIISHDRQFLDRTVSRVIALDWFTRTATLYSGTYTDYLDHKQKEESRKREEHDRQVAEIGRLRASARSKKQSGLRGASKPRVSDGDKLIAGARRERAGKTAARGKLIEERAARMERALEDAPRERDAFVIPLAPTKGQKRHGISLERVVAGHALGFSIAPVTLTIPYGARVGIVGSNGAGKTTLLKTITGDLSPLEGEVHIGSSLIIGNVTQEHENVPLDSTLSAFLEEKGGASKEEAFHLLDRFGFEATEANKRITNLSVGGRVRLLFALFSARKCNVLVLDEPTNHLDYEGIEALERVLETYEGTILLVSHDRMLLEAAALTHVFELARGKLTATTLEKYNPPQIQKRMRQLIKRFNR